MTGAKIGLKDHEIVVYVMYFANSLPVNKSTNIARLDVLQAAIPIPWHKRSNKAMVKLVCQTNCR